MPETSRRDLGFGFTAMASRCEIRLAGLSPQEAEPLARQAIEEVQRIERKYSRYRPDSMLSRINASAGSGDGVAVDCETADLLDFAQVLYQQSAGRFDVSSGVLRRAWDFQSACLPSQAALDALLPLVGWGRVHWQREPGGLGWLVLPLAGMQLDFGGIGKEYAADRAATLLLGQGVRHGLVNLGGDIRVMGPQCDGSAWALGVQHPREPERLLASMALSQGALATSGDYERFMVVDGQRYCHVLDPHTGWPVHAWQSVSVVAPACVAAGALCTLALLMGPEAPNFLRSQNVGFLAVDALGQIHQQPLP